MSEFLRQAKDILWGTKREATYTDRALRHKLIKAGAGILVSSAIGATAIGCVEGTWEGSWNDPQPKPSGKPGCSGPEVGQKVQTLYSAARDVKTYITEAKEGGVSTDELRTLGGKVKEYQSVKAQLDLCAEGDFNFQHEKVKKLSVKEMVDAYSILNDDLK